MNSDITINFHASSRPEISLIICTRNRAAKLQACLGAIEKIHTTLSFEVVVIDNNSSDETFSVISNHARKSKISMRWCTEKGKGTGIARNRGAAVATAEILVYLDDDCYPSEDFIDQYQSIFSQAPELGFVGGRVELYDPTDQPITILTSKTERFFSAHQRLLAGEIISANMGIRRHALNEVNGWDDLFGAGTEFPCEDLDIAARILCSGWPGKYDPKPLVHHHHERKTLADVEMLMASYDAGRGGFYGKCLFSNELRSLYLWPWMKKIRRQPWKVTFREFKSFMNYMTKR